MGSGSPALRGWTCIHHVNVRTFHTFGASGALLLHPGDVRHGRRRAGRDVDLGPRGRAADESLEDQQERIIDILKNAKQPMFLVCVSDQAKRLTEVGRKPVRMEPAVAVRKARIG